MRDQPADPDSAPSQQPLSSPAAISDSRPLTGKIGKDSANLYDDQAGIVFDYFKRAAIKIVAEEDKIKELQDTSDATIKEYEKVISSSSLKMWIALVLTVLALFLFFTPNGTRMVLLALIPGLWLLIQYFDKKKKIKLLEAEQEIRSNLDKNFNHIRRDYAVNKLGVAYVPIATTIPFENKSITLDDTEQTPQRQFSLYQMNSQDEFFDIVRDIESQQKSVPLVESSDEWESVATQHHSPSMENVGVHDYIGNFDRKLRTASFLLNDLTNTSVELPVIDPKSERFAFLREFCTDNVGANPVLRVFRQDAYKEELKRFEELNNLRKRMADETARFEKMLQSFIMDVAEHVQLISRLKLTSSNKLVDFSNSILMKTFQASYNHYSTALEADEITRLQNETFDFHTNGAQYEPFRLDSTSKVKYDPISANWVAEDGSRTSFPLGIHQIQEEIIAPLVQNLLVETRRDRLKIYNNIKDQKLDYLNQWHRDTDDFYGRGRGEGSDIINLMQTTLAEFNTALSQYKAFSETEKSLIQSNSIDTAAVTMKEAKGAMVFSIAYCEEQAKQIRKEQDEFNDYIERLKEDIDRRAAEFSYTRYYDASLQDGHSRDFVTSLASISSMDDRRKRLLAANPYIANKAEIPPEPVINSEVYDILSTNLSELASPGFVASDMAGESDTVSAETGSISINAEEIDGIAAESSSTENPQQQEPEAGQAEDPENTQP